jgi:hypothetical protein
MDLKLGMTRLALMAALFLMAAGAWGNPPLGAPGTVAEYRLEADLAERPAYERENRLTVMSAWIRLGPVVNTTGGSHFQWYGLSWKRLDGREYQMWMLLDHWPTATETPIVMRYLWREPEWPIPLSFVHEANGDTVLPRLSIWIYGFPQELHAGGGNNRAPASGTPERLLLHGWEFRRVSKRQADTTPPSEWTTIKLNPDLLIGWTYLDRDHDGRPHYRLANGKYHYVQKSEGDLMAHILAGSNFLVGTPEFDSLWEWLKRSHVFHGSLAYKLTDWPAGLYRSSYWGVMNHHDEPALGNLGRRGTPSEVARALQKHVLRGKRPTGINERIDSRFGRGKLYFEENANPSWEVLWETAWYQLACPNVGGIVDEDTKMEGAGVLVDLYNMAFETHIPNTIENSCSVRTAVLRGAARNFGKQWGIGFYEPDNVKVRSAEIAHFYEKGATYFWVWTGWRGLEDNSGLPYPYQRQYFSLVRQAYNRNPQRDTLALLKAAKLAIVLPYGYTFSPWHMHRNVWLPLEKKNGHGITFRRVLSNAAQEVERSIRLGIEFDIAVDDPLFNPAGYDELVWIQEDGIIRIVRPGQSDTWSAGPRSVDRPDLGRMPRLTIEVGSHDSANPNRKRFKAVAEIGTGDWGDTGKPDVYWEIYDAESIIELNYSALWPVKGMELTHEFKKPGTYTVRASVADVFGRPAIAQHTVEVFQKQD